MNCRDLRQHLYAYLDGELDPAAQALAEQHLQTCAACREHARHEEQVGQLLRSRLRRHEPAPAGLRQALLEAVQEERAPALRFHARVLASPWAPRLAMAVVLLVILLVPLQVLRNRTPAFAWAAADRHGCHAGIESDGPPPPCCRDLALGAGAVLGDPSPGARVPDLRAAGLQLVRSTHCDFGRRPVNMLSYRDAASKRFSLYISARDTREFKLLRTGERGGLPQFRDSVPVDDVAHGVHETYDVAIWSRAGFVYTWVGPTESVAFEAVLARLQAR